jgi:hypothetical protein
MHHVRWGCFWMFRSADSNNALLKARYAFAVAQLELRQLLISRARKRYDPNQPRVPAGHADSGQWTSGGGSGDASHQSESASHRRKPPTSFRVAGGFEKEHLGMSVQSFVSANCKGRIRAVLPQQFLELSINDVMKAAKSGDRAARTCLKILGRDEYRK